MKKLVIISSLVAAVSLSAFGLGYVTFTGGSRATWDGYSIPGIAKNDTTNSVAFLWAANGSVPLLSAIQGAVATNALANTSGSGTTNGAYSVTTAWNDILTDPLFHFATNSGNSVLVSTNSNANGSWIFSYLGANSFGVQGTAINTTYSLFIIGWNNGGGLYLTPFAAAAAGTFVGWSSVFTYTTTDVPPTGNPGAMVFTSFGVAGSVPEPGTFALAGLGAAAMLIFRRRK